MFIRKAIISILLVVTLVISLTAGIVPAQATDDGIEQFVSRMYIYVLNRYVDQDYSGLRFWSNRLRNGTESGASVAHGFFFSNEFVRANHSNDVFINRLYRAILGRGADERGFAYWINHMNRGMSREGVLAGFIDSREFGNLARQYGIELGTLTVAHSPASAPAAPAPTPESTPTPAPTPGDTAIRDFVLRLYREALGRRVDPSPAEMNYWTSGLSSGRYTGATAAFGFFLSTEMAERRLTDEAFVEALYRGMLGRASNANERAFWVNQLGRGVSRHTVFVGFANSAEFDQVCRAHGIPRGTPPPLAGVAGMVCAALSEVGYHERNRDGSFGSGNFTKFGAWFSNSGQPWCAVFVSWAANQAGILNTVVPRHAWTPSGVEWYRARGRYAEQDSGHLPREGDLIYFHNNVRVHHVGIVVAFDRATQRVFTVEGNSLHAVRVRYYAINDPRIHGFGMNGGTSFGVVPRTATPGDTVNVE